MTAPPSTIIVYPVIYAAQSEARKSAQGAISSFVPALYNGNNFSKSSPNPD